MLKDWFVSDFEEVQLDLNHLKMGSGNRFFSMYFGCFLGSGVVTRGPNESQVGDPSPGVETGVDSHCKICLCAEFDDVHLDLN